MTVYFVLRSHYDEPSGKSLCRFEDDTVLDWFRSHWGLVDEEGVAYERVADLLGWGVDPFIELFGAAFEQGLPPPKSVRQLAGYLQEHIEAEGTILCKPHLVTIRWVDECNMELCSYLFDDAYLARHGKRAVYLLHEGWQLPGGHSEAGGHEPDEPTEEDLRPPGGLSGTTYLVFLFYDYENDGNLTDLWGGLRIEGLRIPDLASYLALRFRSRELFLLLLRSALFDAPFTEDPVEEGFRQVLLNAHEDEDAWRSEAGPALMAYSDWLEERQGRPAGVLFLEQALKALFRLPVLT
jgi:hypothetical protein